MNIDKFTDTIKACRFCFMCRHLSGVGNVTFGECDTPRIRASMIDGITRYPEEIKNADFIRTIYSSDLSAACRFHCVNHFDENGLNLAVRRDIVDANLAPDDVLKLVEELRPRTQAPKIPAGKEDVLYLVDFLTDEVPFEAEAFHKIMKKAKIKFRVAEGCLAAKALKILGFAEEAKKAFEAFAEVVKKSGAKLMVTSDPALFDALKNDFAELGVKCPAKVMHTTEYVASLKLKFSKKAGKVYYLESDFLKNYNDAYKFPKELLKQIGAECAPFGTNNEESYTCGEGAVVLNSLRPKIVAKMAKYVEARADNPESDKIVVSSAYTKAVLTQNTNLKVSTIVELAASCL